MRELEMHEIGLVSGGAGNDAESHSSPWWGSLDYNGDGDLWDESSTWFLGAGAAMGLAAGGMAVTGIGAPAAGATGIAAGISGSIGGLLAVGDYYFG
ncbi:MAG: hypothetical protein AAFX09_07425 [Pseudomonadota bacterium]